MSDLISRKDVLHELDGCDYELKDWQRWKLKTMVRDIPSAEKAQLSEEDATKDATSDLINRQDATTIPVMPKEHREYQTMNLDDAYEQGWFDCQKCIEELPSAEPERLTDDDFETIRIHLNAQKEKLCNQQRWEEAEEYQRIIDRFMAFASAEPERKTAEWIYGENGGQDGWYCSKCGLFIPWDYEYYGLDNIDFIADFHTCPKCDRKMLKYTGMRGEQDE